ncbi:hypothetical protein ACIBF7_25605 [Nonomuraea sp. NPDC050478]|uniref:hypothetical protein n=1 Tax=Nonomuraea sp. NPDC050478 TaxID=3364365 RepID=UPI00378BBB3D
MADHDRDAGSRGEEEPPRDPNRRDTRPTPYGELGPGPYSGPGWGPLPAPPAKPTLRDFLRRKQTQVVGAGLAGLVVGGLIGGGAVALTGALWARPGPADSWQRPGERPPVCLRIEGRVICDLQPAPLPTRVG